MEKVEPVQVRFTLCFRDPQGNRMQDGCKVYMNYTNSYVNMWGEEEEEDDMQHYGH